MKRRLLSRTSIKQTLLAVPAAALMLGAAQAGTTVGLNVRTWTYANGGAGYQTTGFPVTAKAFGVDVPNWTSPEPFYAYAPVSATVVMGAITAQLEATNPWQSGIGALINDWVPQTVTPGDDEVTWGILDNTGWSVGLSGLNAAFPNGYVIQTIAASKVTANSRVAITDGVNFTNSYAFNIHTAGLIFSSGPVGMQVPTGTLTNDAITMSSPSRSVSGTLNCALAGFIVTDKPVVSEKPVGGSYNAGATISMVATAIGVGNLSYQWRLNGNPIPNAQGPVYLKNGATPADSGNYDLVVTNLYGAGTSVVAVVTVSAVPTIMTDVAADGTNFSTMNHSFFVVAGGQEPLSYRWTHAGTNLPGANSATLSLSNLKTTDSGDYQLVVTNSIGSATSSVAKLTVLASLPPSDGFAYADGSVLGQNGGTGGWSGAWAQTTNYNGENYVLSPGATYRDAASDLSVSGGALQLGATGSADFECIRDMQVRLGGSGTIYLSFIDQVVNSGWGGVGLVDGTSEVLFLGTQWYAQGWGWGGRGGGGPASAFPPTVQSFLVYRFDFTPTNALVKLYVNPALAAEPSTPSLAGTWASFKFDKIRVPSHNMNSGVCDELRVGGSWAAVTPHTPRADAPTIVKDLAGTTTYAYAGASPTMFIVADGAPTLHYIWKKNGTTTVGGDSASLTLTSVTTVNSGDYSVTVTNTSGSVTSLTNRLTVLAAPNSYTGEVTKDSPASYWPLVETVDPTAFDYSGSGNNGTQNGAFALGVAGPRPPAYQGFQAGKLAYQFDGTSSYIDCGTAASLSGTTDFTLEAWISTTNSATTYLLQQRSGYNGEYMFVMNANGTLGFTVYRDGYQFDFSSPITAKRVNDGRWHHVAAVRSGTNGGIYIDGSVVATATGPSVKALDPTFPTVIGRDQRDSKAYFNGQMCDVAIYSHALSATRIASHAATGILGTSPLALSIVPGGFVEDSKPGTPKNDGLNNGASWLASSTDAIPVTRTGVERFSGGAQVAIPANADFNSSTGTICFWMRTGVPAAGTGSMLFDRRAGNGVVILLNGTPSGGVDVQYTGNPSYATPSYVVDDNWHHVAFIYDQSASGSTALYVDGVLAGGQLNTAAWSWSPTQQIELARSHDTYWQQYNGQMDDVRIYNRILNDAEIATIATPATSNTLIDTAALKARYNFDTAGIGKSLSWPLGLLESSPTLGPSAIWTPVSGAVSPYPFLLVPEYTPTNRAAFYRLKL